MSKFIYIPPPMKKEYMLFELTTPLMPPPFSEPFSINVNILLVKFIFRFLNLFLGFGFYERKESRTIPIRRIEDTRTNKFAYKNR